MNQDTTNYLTKFWKQNYLRLVRYAKCRLSRLSYKDGEDIVQDVMLNLLNKADFIAPIENLTAYVFRCLQNKIIDEIRAESRSVVSLNSLLNENSSTEFIELVQCVDEDFEESYEVLHCALKKLSTEHRFVIVENELKGRKLKDIAQELNLPLGTVLARKSRGMKLLKAIIETMEDNHV
ncbi:MAG: RNA polymerase sigma factor [Candidatus Cloacimonetes bacterium]|nr:RNA polymerase sigma factor [Candidatus Cloacimonadota bacterium]